eukprot:SAG25_NODE_9691_length_362_cov_0.703422_1_plen_78_part_10
MREIAHSSIEPARRPLLRLASCTCVDCTACVIQTNCKPPANAEQTLLATWRKLLLAYALAIEWPGYDTYLSRCHSPRE